MRRTVLLLAVVVLMTTACGDDEATTETTPGATVSTAGPQVTDAWSRSSPAMQGAGVVYFTLTAGSERAVLSGVTVPTDVAAFAMLHESLMDDEGVMSMAPVVEVAAEPGETISFEPGGYHVMMMELVDPLVAGDTFEITLSFGDGATLTVPVEVREE